MKGMVISLIIFYICPDREAGKQGPKFHDGTGNLRSCDHGHGRKSEWRSVRRLSLSCVCARVRARAGKKAPSSLDCLQDSRYVYPRPKLA
jgi:hypothetical protein